MKNLNQTVIFTFIGLLLMASIACDNSRETEEVDLKENEELKENVFNQILNDEELFTEFTTEMRENRLAMRRFSSGGHMREMMRGNPEMHQQMMQNMTEMMENDTTMRPNPEMRRQMMQNMMRIMKQDTAMQNRMRQMMHEQNMN